MPKLPLFFLSLLSLTVFFSSNAQTVLHEGDFHLTGQGKIPIFFCEVNGTEYFVAQDPNSNYCYLWESDGTAQGSTRIENMKVYTPFNHHDFIYLRVYYGFGATINTKFIRYNTFDGATQDIKDINDNHLSVEQYFVINDTLYITASNDDGIFVWRIDENSLTAQKIGNDNFVTYNGGMNGSAGSDFIVSMGNHFYYSDGISLIKKDLQGNSTALTSPASPPSLQPCEFVVMGNQVFFKQKMQSTEQYQLCVTDGSFQGTMTLKYFNDIDPLQPSQYAIKDGYLYFLADDGLNGPEIWKTDGTVSGTQMLYNSPVDGANFLSEFVILNDKIYYTYDDGTYGDELWVTNGTTSGTHIVKDIFPGAEGANIGHLTAYRNKIYFVANHIPQDRQVWTSDGTTNGTHLISPPDYTQNALGSTVSFYNGFTPYKDTLYFYASYDGDHINAIYKIYAELGSNAVNPNSPNLNVYPNPVNDILVINVANPGTYIISTTSGNMVYSNSIINSTQINLDFLNPGTYILHSPENGSLLFIKN